MTKSARHLHLDVLGGIAGDMFCAAVLDAFPEWEGAVVENTTAVLPPKVGTLRIWQEKKNGMRARRFALCDMPEHEHHGHHHTHYTDLVSRIQSSDIPEAVSDIASGILKILAQSESKMHDVPIERVHFHELADWDSLLDVVAAATLIDKLALKSYSVSKLPLGQGLVNTQHGKLPVPAPATAEILRGFSFIDDGVAGERITPTGAAILRYLADSVEEVRVSGQSLDCIGVGAGEKTFESLPNLLRLLIFVPEQKNSHDWVLQIEFDVDDMTPEELALSADILRAVPGVVDVTSVQLQGKKGRAVTRIGIMGELSQREVIFTQCFTQFSTIGLRHQLSERVVLPRTHEYMNIDGRELRYKSVLRAPGTHTKKIESDDLREFSTLAERRAAARKVEEDANE